MRAFRFASTVALGLLVGCSGSPPESADPGDSSPTPTSTPISLVTTAPLSVEVTRPRPSSQRYTYEQWSDDQLKKFGNPEEENRHTLSIETQYLAGYKAPTSVDCTGEYAEGVPDTCYVTYRGKKAEWGISESIQSTDHLKFYEAELDVGVLTADGVHDQFYIENGPQKGSPEDPKDIKLTCDRLPEVFTVEDGTGSGHKCQSIHPYHTVDDEGRQIDEIRQQEYVVAIQDGSLEFCEVQTSSSLTSPRPLNTKTLDGTTCER